MEIERKIVKIGGSLGIVIPLNFLNHINVSEGDIIIMKDDEGKHGSFISFWNKNQQKQLSK
jgi:antitoxin component of MazEF toxin-antitoxin module